MNVSRAAKPPKRAALVVGGVTLTSAASTVDEGCNAGGTV